MGGLLKPTEIKLGAKVVGKVSVDVEGIRGEGDYRKPTLVFPLVVALEEKHAPGVFVWELSCSLDYLADRTYVRLGDATLVNWSYCSPWYVDFRIPLTHSALSLIQERQHKISEEPVWFTLGFHGRVAGVYEEPWNSSSQGQLKDPPLPEWRGLGLIRKLAFFDGVMIPELQIRVAASEWTYNVLSKLGLDRLRLIELVVPDEGSLFGEVDAKKAVHLLEEAVKEFNSGRPLEAIQKCRDVFERFRDALTRIAPNKEPEEGEKDPVVRTMALAVADRLSWGKDASQTESLQHCLQAVKKLTDRSHHKEASFSLADARFCLLLLSVLLDYFGRLAAQTKIRQVL